MSSDFVKLVQGRNPTSNKSLDCKEAVQAFTVKSVDVENRRVEGIASSEILDRDGEIVTIAALRKAMKGYMENAVVLAGHAHRLADGHSPTVGRVVGWRIAGKQLWVTVEFAKTELGEEYWILYRDKVQRAFSIGFNTLKIKDEIIDGTRVRKIVELVLYEISCVPVPANPQALTKAKRRKRDFVQRKKTERSGWPFAEGEGGGGDDKSMEFAKAIFWDVEIENQRDLGARKDVNFAALVYPGKYTCKL